eukprot:511170-Hanusia_phi.AAC.3
MLRNEQRTNASELARAGGRPGSLEARLILAAFPPLYSPTSREALRGTEGSGTTATLPASA